MVRYAQVLGNWHFPLKELEHCTCKSLVQEDPSVGDRKSQSMKVSDQFGSKLEAAKRNIFSDHQKPDAFGCFT